MVGVALSFTICRARNNYSFHLSFTGSSETTRNKHRASEPVVVKSEATAAPPHPPT